MITVSDLMKVANRKGYAVFENDSKPYNLNIWAVRDPETGFNDTLHVFWKYKGNWSILSWKCTTDPGQSYLKNPLNEKGTAILQENQWRGCWEIGLHKGQYTALVQRAPITVWRDYNKDNNLDYTNPDTGMFGINLHRSHSEVEVSKIGKYSAGCLVTHNPDEFDIFMNVCQKSSEQFGNKFSVTLININDL